MENNRAEKVLRLDDLRGRVEKFVEKAYLPEADSRQVVLYGGNPEAYIMVIARDLGRSELEENTPLIGKAGQLLRDGCKKIGFNPELDFIMCNTVPLKPKDNKAFSALTRSKFIWILNDLFGIVLPTTIITLGYEATTVIFPECLRIKPYVGLLFEKNGVKIFPNYHPSYISRQGGLDTSEGQDFLNVFLQVKNL